MNKTALIVYSRAGCHLCDALIDELTEFCSGNPFTFTDIDISGKEDLEKLYGLKVPVVTYNNIILCEYFLDTQAINAYFGISPKN